MSHDRGCFKCGKEQWEYSECLLGEDCPKSDFPETNPHKPEVSGNIAYYGEEMADNSKVKINVQLGVTKNIGNYESVRYDVGLTVEGQKGSENDLYKYANEWVGKKINEFNKGQVAER